MAVIWQPTMQTQSMLPITGTYTLGAAADTTPVIFDRRSSEITRNPHSFLRQSWTNEPDKRSGHFWIDSIYIIKADNEEKSVQVNMMDRIYAHNLLPRLVG